MWNIFILVSIWYEWIFNSLVSISLLDAFVLMNFLILTKPVDAIYKSNLDSGSIPLGSTIKESGWTLVQFTNKYQF